MTRTKQWLTCVTVAVLLAAPSSALAASFNIGVRGFPDCSQSPVSVSGSPTPVSAFNFCDNGRGAFGSAARSTFGSLGTQSTASTFDSLAGGNSQTTARFQDMVVFTKTDPNAPDVFDVSLNMVLRGILAAAANASQGNFVAQADFTLVASIGGHGFALRASHRVVPFNGIDTFELVNTLGAISGLEDIVAGPGGFEALLVTAAVPIGIGPNNLVFDIFSAAATFGPDALAVSDFLGSLELPTDIDVFNLPPGYTANAGDYLVNNRFIDPNAPDPDPDPNGVPAPATGLLLGAALLGLMARRRFWP